MSSGRARVPGRCGSPQYQRFAAANRSRCMRTAADLRRDAADLGMFNKKDKYASAEQDAGGGLGDLSRKLASTCAST